MSVDIYLACRGTDDVLQLIANKNTGDDLKITTIKIARLVAAMLIAAPFVANAANVTYTFDLPTIGDASVSGTVTTDGKLGVLTISDIVSWNITETFGSVSLIFTENPGNSFLDPGQGTFDANATGLFVPSGTCATCQRLLWNDQQSSPNYFSSLEIGSNAAASSGTVQYTLFNATTDLDQDIQARVVSVPSGPFYFATASIAPVPLPAAAWLMLSALGALGAVAGKLRHS